MKLTKKIPTPGLRNIKTAIAVFVALLLYSYIGREGVLFAAMAILICLQDSVEKSIKEGLSRTIGTIIGAIFGIIFIYINSLQLSAYLYYIFTMIGLVLLIHICNLLNLRRSIVIAGVVYLVIILGAGDNPFIYSVNRTLDTIFGIGLAVIVNRFVLKPKEVSQKQIKLLVKDSGTIINEINFDKYFVDETAQSTSYTVEIEDLKKDTEIFNEGQ